jgi:hypothetical protein
VRKTGAGHYASDMEGAQVAQFFLQTEQNETGVSLKPQYTRPHARTNPNTERRAR